MTTAVAVSKVTTAGLNGTTPPTAAASAMTLPNAGTNPNGSVVLKVKTGGTTANLTLTPTATVPDGGSAALAVATRVVALAANSEYYFGPFNQGLWNDSNQNVNLAFDAVTAITVMGISLGN